jgi:tagatose-1,6-bisphosphate aldolase non-catalytic subunit AgaZ/GatZ
MYTRQIGILIDAVDGSEENYMLLVEALVAEVNHLQTYLISRGMTVADYQEYLDTLSRTTIH